MNKPVPLSTVALFTLSTLDHSILSFLMAKRLKKSIPAIPDSDSEKPGPNSIPDSGEISATNSDNEGDIQDVDDGGDDDEEDEILQPVSTKRTSTKPVGSVVGAFAAKKFKQGALSAGALNVIHTLVKQTQDVSPLRGQKAYEETKKGMASKKLASSSKKLAVKSKGSKMSAEVCTTFRLAIGSDTSSS